MNFSNQNIENNKNFVENCDIENNKNFVENCDIENKEIIDNSNKDSNMNHKEDDNPDDEKSDEENKSNDEKSDEEKSNDSEDDFMNEYDMETQENLDDMSSNDDYDTETLSDIPISHLINNFFSYFNTPQQGVFYTEELISNQFPYPIDFQSIAETFNGETFPQESENSSNNEELIFNEEEEEAEAELDITSQQRVIASQNIFNIVNDHIISSIIDNIPNSSQFIFVIPSQFNISQNIEDTYESLNELIETVGSVSRGLSKDDLGKLPISKYQKKDNKESCTICLSEFENNEDVIILPSCLHIYHHQCISTWLATNKICPICRNEINI
jgi:hypothetical protein